jgi:hypothetical protein
MAKKKPEKKTMSKSTAKKTAAKKTAKTKAKPKTSKPIYKASGKSTRRPSTNPDMPISMIANLQVAFKEKKNDLEEYAAHLRSLDRKRLNGVGMKKQGFIKRAYELAFENQEFLLHYLTIKKFDDDFNYFTNLKIMCTLANQIYELLWNITIQAADIAYTDALEFYASVREASKRRVDAAESLYKELEIFFKHKKTSIEDEAPTEKKLMQDAKAIARGKKDGKIVIENIKPKLTGGAHKVIDEKFMDTAHFKETESGEIEE